MAAVIKQLWAEYTSNILAELEDSHMHKLILGEVKRTLAQIGNSLVSTVVKDLTSLGAQLCRIPSQIQPDRIKAKVRDYCAECLEITSKPLDSGLFIDLGLSTKLTSVPERDAFIRRLKWLKGTLVVEAGDICEETINQIQRAIDKKRNETWERFPKYVEEAIGSVRSAIRNATSRHDTGALASLREKANRHYSDWAQHLQFSETDGESQLQPVKPIPDVLTVQDLGKAHPDMSSNGQCYYADLASSKVSDPEFSLAARQEESELVKRIRKAIVSIDNTSKGATEAAAGGK